MDSRHQSTLPDPPRRADNLCALPGCTKPLVKATARHRRYGGDALDKDPFCSTGCCRAWHQCPISERSVCSLYEDAA